MREPRKEAWANSGYSRKIAQRHWNLPEKGEMESQREETFIDDIVQKSHLEKELLASLDGVSTAFDGGAGSGRFSILLAKKGIHVTHFDISQPMLDKAQQLAQEAGVLHNITFVRGALEDLSAYADRSFDLVLSFDAPVLCVLSASLKPKTITIKQQILCQFVNNSNTKERRCA